MDYPDFGSCYPIVTYVIGTLSALIGSLWCNDSDTQTYLNNPSVQEALGIDRHHGNFSWVNMEINTRLNDDDKTFRAEHYLEALLQRGVKALIYVGDSDWICNWVCSITCSAFISD